MEGEEIIITEMGHHSKLALPGNIFVTSMERSSSSSPLMKLESYFSFSLSLSIS